MCLCLKYIKRQGSSEGECLQEEQLVSAATHLDVALKFGCSKQVVLHSC